MTVKERYAKTTTKRKHAQWPRLTLWLFIVVYHIEKTVEQLIPHAHEKQHWLWAKNT